MTTPLSYREAMAEDQRLLILQHLLSAPDQTAAVAELRPPLIAARHLVSHDALLSLLDWLDEANLIILMGGATKVARLTARGQDVAVGLARQTGVARVTP